MLLAGRAIVVYPTGRRTVPLLTTTQAAKV
jgi:hypothetical protein